MEDLLTRIEELERENVETSNVLYEILNRLELLENDYVLRSNKFREGNGSLCE
jgi:hypothetical protein